MSTSSPLDDKELVRQAIDIVDLVGSHIQLRRQGSNYVGLCPWHDDSRPSLQVNPERQSWKCWVCDLGGDIFSFVMKHEGVEFREALEMLADRAGIQLQRSRPAAVGSIPGAPSGAGDKRSLFQAMAWVEQQYHDCLLKDPQAEPARNYLDQRGITAESIDKFHLGFSPNESDWLLRKVKGDPQRQRILETIGVIARPPEGGGYYDRFRGRVLFSIRDTQGRPVGIGGRILPESGATSRAKYLNSPETPLFTKSNLLYALDVARDPIRRGDETALVMEGYTDVIVAHQFGFDNAVAVLGTALGEGHIRILKRFAERIVLVLDGDEAGQRRAGEVLELFVAQQADLRILTLPEGNDPCDFLQEHGADAFTDLIENRARDALDHAFETTTQQLDLEHDVHGATQALERLVSIVAKAPRLRADTTAADRFREEKILQRLAARFRVDEVEVRRRLTALRRQARRRTPAPPPEDAELIGMEAEIMPAETLDPWQRELLELLIAYPEQLATLRQQLPPEQLAAGLCRRIYETLCRLTDEGAEATFDRLMLQFDQPAIKSLLVELDEAREAKGREVDPEALFEALIQNFRKQEARRQRPAQLGKLREGGLDDSQETELLEKIIQQERSRQGISESTDG